MLQLFNFLGGWGAADASKAYQVGGDRAAEEEATAHKCVPVKVGKRQEDEESTASSEGATSRGSTASTDSLPQTSSQGKTLVIARRQTVRDFRHLVKRYAHTSFDLEVAWRAFEMVGIDLLVDENFVVLVLETLSLMHRCGYTVDVTVMSVAWAVIYCKDDCVCKALEQKDVKLAQIRFCMHLFLAHTYLVDEPCFLSTWHKYVLQDVCELEELNMELMRLFKLRNYKLIVDPQDCDRVYSALSEAMQMADAGKRVAAAILRDEENVPQCIDGDY